MRVQTKKLILWFFVLFIVGILAFFGIEYKKETPIIRTFDDCVFAGKRVVESVPRRCEIIDGQFIVDIKGINKGDAGEKGRCASYTFEKYKTNETLKTLPFVNYETYSEAKNFEGEIENEIENGPNFSGYYVVPTWSCGVACKESAIIDGRTGKILIFGITSQYGVETKKDSTLFVVNSAKNIPIEEGIGDEGRAALFTSYYVLENNALMLLCRENAYAK
ncbi:MAG: hypothetical protein WC842_03540 [Candidatus Paceibacterota bacterium]|jgi:hypothetical protein